MRFAEVLDFRGSRAWNIACEACGMTRSNVKGISDLMKHVKSAKHVNALSADEDVGTRVDQHRRVSSFEGWLQQHATGHRMRFTECAGRQGRRAWNIDCDACASTLHRVSSVKQVEVHLNTAAHVGAKLSAVPATRARKRARS
jgi:hypothetical protein